MWIAFKGVKIVFQGIFRDCYYFTNGGPDSKKYESIKYYTNELLLLNLASYVNLAFGPYILEVWPNHYRKIDSRPT